MKNFGRFVCSDCKTVFSFVGSNLDDAVQCPKCGGKKAKKFDSLSMQKVTASAVFKCLSCNHEFREDVSLGNSVFCNVCKSSNCKAITPMAIVYSGIKSLAETKKDRFIFNSWQEYKKLKSLADEMLKIFSALGVSDSTRAALTNNINKACKEANDFISMKKEVLSKA